MNSSDKIDALAKALIAAQREMRPASKSATNPHFGSKYAPLPEVIEVAKVLHNHGIAFLQPTYTTSEEKVGIETVIIHAETGQWLSGDLILTPQQNTPQGIGSAITYGRRFGLASLIGIVAEEDDDGNAASHAEKPRKIGPASHRAGGSDKRGAEAKAPPAAVTPARPGVPFDAEATEKRMLLELLGGFDTWDQKRAWREQNQAAKNQLPTTAQLRVSAAFLEASPVTKQSGVAP